MFQTADFSSASSAQTTFRRFHASEYAKFLKVTKDQPESVATEATESHRILLLEADRPLARLLSKGIVTEHLAVDVVSSEGEAFGQIANHTYGVIILSLDLAEAGAHSMIRRVRSLCPSAGVLVLGRGSNMREMITVLDQGADDCMSKPFSLLEMTARVRALQRRTGMVPKQAPKLSSVVLNRTEYRVERSGKTVDLTPREFALLEYMVKHAGQALSRSTLMQAVWNMAEDANTNIVDVYMKYLRDKLDSAEGESLIRTVRGVGYVLSNTCHYSQATASA